MNKPKKNNVVNFPSGLSEGEREAEAILFAAAEPLDIESIEARISKKTNVLKILEKLKQTYSKRGINLVYISKKWSFRTSPILSKLMTQEKTVEKKLSKKKVKIKNSKVFFKDKKKIIIIPIGEWILKKVNLFSVTHSLENFLIASSFATGSNACTIAPALIREFINTTDGASRISSVPGLNESPQTANIKPFKSDPYLLVI